MGSDEGRHCFGPMVTPVALRTVLFSKAPLAAAARPFRLVRHAGHGTWDDRAGAILGPSKMNWNNDSLYDTLPVTLAYARVLAGVAKRIPNLGTTLHQFRFFA